MAHWKIVLMWISCMSIGNCIGFVMGLFYSNLLSK